MVERALVVCPEPPYPLAGGGPMRTASLLHFLARRFELDLVLFAVEGASDPADALPRGLVRGMLKIPLAAHSRSFLRRAFRNGRRALAGIPPLVDRFAPGAGPLRRWLEHREYALGVIEHFWCAPFETFLAPHCRRLWIDLHNVDSAWHESAAAIAPWPASAIHRRFARSARRLENRHLQSAARVLVPSRADALRLPPSIPKAVVYPNAIPFVAAPAARPKEAIVFSGNLEYEPNREAVRWFRSHVWPALRRDHPGLAWHIVGRNEHAARPLVEGDPRIHLSGPVPDAVSEIAGCRAAIVPVLSGSGTRVKILEAWAASVPVVSTRLGAEGLEAEAGVELLLGDSPREFLGAIGRLLRSAEMRKQIGLSGRRLYESRYTWEAAWKTLEPEWCSDPTDYT